MQNNQSPPTIGYENILIEEKIFKEEYINEGYTIFVLLCDNNSFEITPKDFTEILKKIALSNGINVEVSIISQYFFEVDIDKSGRINFQDFLIFITQNLKLIFGEIKYKKGINHVHSLTSPESLKEFSKLISTFFLKLLNVTNPFWFTSTSQTYLPLYTMFIQNMNRTGIIKQTPPEVKFEKFNDMIKNMNNIDYIATVAGGINNSSSYEGYLQGIALLKKLLKPCNFISSHYIIIHYLSSGMSGGKLLARNRIFEKLLTSLTSVNFQSYNQDVHYLLLKTGKRLGNLSNFLFETKEYCTKPSEYSLNYYATKDNVIDINHFQEGGDTKIIPQMLQHLPFGLEHSNYNIFHTTALIVQGLIKKHVDYFRNIFLTTNYFDTLISKAQNNTDLINFLGFNCIGITERIVTCSEFNINDIAGIHSVTVKGGNIATNGIELIFQFTSGSAPVHPNINSGFTKTLFFIFISLLSYDHSSFDNVKFLSAFAFSPHLRENSELYIPFTFYIEGGINSSVTPKNSQPINSGTSRASILPLGNQFDILTNINNYVKMENIHFYNKFLDVLELIISNHANELSKSNIINDILLFLSEAISSKQENAEYKAVKMLYRISEGKDSIIIGGMIDKEIVKDIVKGMNRAFVINDTYFKDLFLLEKKRFNTGLIEKTLLFLLNVINSDIPKNTEKFILQFSVDNLRGINTGFNDLALLWNINNYYNDTNNQSHGKELNNGISGISLENSTNNSTQVKDTTSGVNYQLYLSQLVFEKYKDLPTTNLLSMIIKLFDQLSYSLSISGSTITSISTNVNTLIPVEMKKVGGFLEAANAEMKNKYRFTELNSKYDSIDKLMPILKINTQNAKEADEKMLTCFTYPSETVSYDEVIQGIKENYNSSVDLYVFDKEDNGYIKIKNEKDFGNYVKLGIDSYLKNGGNDANTLELFFRVQEKEENTSQIKTHCINCSKEIKIVMKEKVYDQSENPPLCEECKKLFFAQIASQINMNKTLNLTGVNGNIMNMSMPTNGANSSIMNSSCQYKVGNRTMFTDK